MPDDMSFEREKWLADQDFRDREFKLKERDQQNRDNELRLKERELRSSTWRSPLVVAIFAAAVAASGNAFVVWLNAQSQRELDNSKAESARILEMIKTDDPQRAAVNLAFLLKSGLISDPFVGEKIIRQYDPARPFLRTLLNKKKFDAPTREGLGDAIVGGEIWGAFFWDIRLKLGAAVTDSLVASAWQSFSPRAADRTIIPAFMEALLSEAKRRGNTTLETVRSAATARGIPLPEPSRP